MLDRLARTKTASTENTDRHVAHGGPALYLAGATRQELEAFRSEMATKTEVRLLVKDPAILRRDMEEGIFHATTMREAIWKEAKDLREMDAELTDLQVLVKRLEKKVSILG